jgi:hypothetical protein
VLRLGAALLSYQRIFVPVGFFFRLFVRSFVLLQAMQRSVCSDPLSPLFLVHLPSHLPRTPATFPSWAGIPVAMDASEDAVDVTAAASSTSSSSSSAAAAGAAAAPVGTAAASALSADKAHAAQSAAAQRPYMDRLAEEMYQFEHGPNLKSLPSGYLGSLVVLFFVTFRIRIPHDALVRFL